jgi:hypothetical protein
MNIYVHLHIYFTIYIRMDVYSSRNVENELELCRTDGTGTYTFAVTAQE